MFFFNQKITKTENHMTQFCRGLLLGWWTCRVFFFLNWAAFAFSGDFGSSSLWSLAGKCDFFFFFPGTEKVLFGIWCVKFFCLTVNTENIKIYIWILTQIKESSIFLLIDVTRVKDRFKNLHLSALNINNLFRKIIFMQICGWRGRVLLQDHASRATARKRLT